MENKEKKSIVPYSLYWYRSEPLKDDFVVHVKPMWPLSLSKEGVTKKSLKDFVEDQIKKDVDSGYLEVEVVNIDHVKVIFKSEKWLRDNFLKNPDVKFCFPRTLIWNFKKLLPAGLMGHADWVLVEKWLEYRFKNFLIEKQKTIFENKFKFFKKLNINWFDIKVDLQMNKIYLQLKTTVMMTAAVSVYAAKELTKKTFRDFNI